MLALNKKEAPASANDSTQWIEVCALSDIVVGTGAAALVLGHQVAIFRPTTEGPLYALSNFDPFSRAFVMSRGIIGDKSGTLKVASPIYKQSFALESGQCLDDPTIRLQSYPVRVKEKRVWIGINEPRGPRALEH
jgi:nitrite reductase (NADH) small subunit